MDHMVLQRSYTKRHICVDFIRVNKKRVTRKGAVYVQFLVRLVSSYRYTDDYVMSELAKFEASLLINAIKKREIHDEDFLRIITTRNKSQLKATFLHYKRLSGKSIDEVTLTFLPLSFG